MIIWGVLEWGEREVCVGMLWARGLREPFEQTLMLKDGIAIGHSCEVVADGAMHTLLRHAAPCLGTNLVWVMEEEIEQLGEHADGFEVGLVNFGIVVEVFVEVAAEFLVLLFARRAVTHEPRAVLTHILNRRNLEPLEPFLCGTDDVLDLIIDEASDDEVATTFVGEFAVLASDIACGIFPDRDAFREGGLGE